MVAKTLCKCFLGLVGASLLLNAFGCSSSQAAGSAPNAQIIALDSSDSAKPYHEIFFGNAKNRIGSMSSDTTLYLYRFDSSPAETWSEPPPGSDEETAKLVKETLRNKSKTLGTNLSKLMQEVDKRLEESKVSADLVIYTDCGTEKMSSEDKATATSLAEKWRSKGSVRSIEFVGVQPGFREEIRDILKQGPDWLRFTGGT